MPLITETYYLSLTQDNRGILRLRCSQDDTLRTVNLKLYNNGSIFVIPSGISASISGVKQNGAVFSKPCTISQNRESVVLQLSSDITNVDGIIVAEIVLNDGEGGRLGTSNFIIQVEKNPIRAGVVQDTETPIEYINDFIEKIQTLTARLNNLITPSGDPSLAEVVDARIGILDSTTYQTLGARLNAEFQRLSNALNGVTIIESTGDTTDRTGEILSKLNTYGACKLGKGDFYVSGLVMPEGSHLVGSGNSTRIILPSSVTNGYIVKPRSNCIIENVSFYGGFTGTHSELIASAETATRHCIILDRFNNISSENVILNNIFINNFVGSAIIQRYTTGCHCEDIIINMCYSGIDISNASYDGQCTNISMTDTRFGVVQNGSNFIFNNCISKDSEYHIMSDQQNTECTFSSCTFSDSSLETTSKLAYLSNARNGFVFDNCTFDSSLKMGLNACDGIVIKGTNFVGSDTFRIIVSNGRNTLLLITDCIADVEPVVTNAGTAARITSCYLKDGTAWTISEADITVDDELSDESENPVQNKVVTSAISEINESLGDLSNLETTDKSSIVAAINEAAQSGGSGIIVDNTLTIAGAAADAKKTGDEISEIKADLDDYVKKDGSGEVLEKNTTFFSASPNLINPSGVVDGYRITQNGADVYEDAGRSTTDYIDIENIDSVTYCYFPNGIKTLTTFYYVLYDSNKVALANRAVTDAPLNVSNASYIRISFTTTQKESNMLYDSAETVPEYKPFGYTFKYDNNQIIDVTPNDDIIAILLSNVRKTIRFTDGAYDIIAIYKAKFGNDYFDNYTGYTSGGNNVGRGLPVLRGTKIQCTEGAVFTAVYTGDNTNVRSSFSAFALESDVTIDGLNITTSGIRNAIHDDFDNNFSGITIIKNCKLISDNKVIAGGLALHDCVIIENCYIKSTVANTSDFSYHNNGNSGAQSKIIIKDNYLEHGVSLRYYGTSTLKSEAFVSNNSMTLAVEYIPENASATVDNINVRAWNNEIRI